jgi:hypothetical protein
VPAGGDAPFINKGYFKEVFEKFSDKLKCDVELASSDDQSEGQRQLGRRHEHSEESEQ